jgi:hypothetical protein
MSSPSNTNSRTTHVMSCICLTHSCLLVDRIAVYALFLTIIPALDRHAYTIVRGQLQFRDWADVLADGKKHGQILLGTYVPQPFFSV